MENEERKVHEVIKKSNSGVQYIDEKAIQVLNKYGEMQRQMDLMEEQVNHIKEALYQSMEANGIKSFETEGYKFTLVAPVDTFTLDRELMKREGTYDYYNCKKSHRNGYVKYTVKAPAKAE